MKVIQSYVWHGSECFFVSTIERESSAILAPGRYNETMVWEYDCEKRKQGDLVTQDEGSRGSISTHQKVCERIFDEGRYWEKEEDE